MSTASAAGAAKRNNPLSHIAAIELGRGASTLLRIVRINLRHPWMVTVAIVATIVAASLQLAIPRLLGHAVDQAHGVATGGALARAAWGGFLRAAKQIAEEGRFDEFANAAPGAELNKFFNEDRRK